MHSRQSGVKIIDCIKLKMNDGACFMFKVLVHCCRTIMKQTIQFFKPNEIELQVN